MRPCSQAAQTQVKGGQGSAQGPKASPPSNTLLDFELFLPVGLREAPHEHIIMSSILELPKFREAWALGHARGPGKSDYAYMPQVDPSELHVPPFVMGSVSDSLRSPGCQRSRLLTEVSQSSGWLDRAEGLGRADGEGDEGSNQRSPSFIEPLSKIF